MWRQGVELQCLDMGKWLRGLEAGNTGAGRMRADIDDDFASLQHARAIVVQGHFDRFWCDETAGSHDELGTAGFIGVEVESDVAVNHVLFAPPNDRQVGRNWTGL